MDERRKRDLRRQDFGLHLKFDAKAINHLERECLFADRFVDVSKSVGEGLQSATISADGHVALDGGAEFLTDVDRTSRLVVVEESVQFCPDFIRRAVCSHDNVQELIGESRIDPKDDGDVFPVPFVVLMLRVGVVFNVVAGIELGEDEQHEFLPLGVVIGCNI